MRRLAMAAAVMVLSGAVLSGQVPYQRIVDAATTPGDWLTYNGGYFGHRHSPLTELTAANVDGLVEKLRQTVQAAYEKYGAL